MSQQKRVYQRQPQQAKAYSSVIEGLKHIYKNKVRPVEANYNYEDFYSPLLKDGDFDAKPTVMLLGQYSVGKTSFIRYLLGQDFQGMRISAEPTTDKFSAIYSGSEDRLIPGNTLAIQADAPFRGLSKFGIDFLNRFQGCQSTAPILQDITFIDTPGVLSGEKQRFNRGYDFPSVCEWFAERSDLVVLIFDAHKLDISDEFRDVIKVLGRHVEKMRVVLNKADTVDSQTLMRVYGALMWFLGRVISTPEVIRVYLGSFWDQDYSNKQNCELFNDERKDLLRELYLLPKGNAVRKVNEIVKRARLAKVLAFIVSHLRSKMPMLWGHADVKKELIFKLKDIFWEVQKLNKLAVGDFPNVARAQGILAHHDFDKFKKMDLKLISSMEKVLEEEIPKLMAQFPPEQSNPDSYSFQALQSLEETFAPPLPQKATPNSLQPANQIQNNQNYQNQPQQQNQNQPQQHQSYQPQAPQNPQTPHQNPQTPHQNPQTPHQNPETPENPLQTPQQAPVSSKSDVYQMMFQQNFQAKGQGNPSDTIFGNSSEEVNPFAFPRMDE